MLVCGRHCKKLVGRDSGLIFDRLSEAQLRLQRGEDGIGKPLSLSQGALRKIAEARPSTLTDLDRIGDLGPQKIERFGEAFLEVLREA